MGQDRPVRVFVYGTLMREEVNHHLLARASFVCEARTVARFQLYDLGAFPALVEVGAGQVAGEVYELDEAALHRLDVLEGHPRFYLRREIELEDESPADTYLLSAERVVGARVIEHGIWRNHERAQRRFRITLQSGETLEGDTQDLLALLHARKIGVDEIATLLSLD